MTKTSHTQNAAFSTFFLQYRAFYDAVADGLVERRWELEGGVLGPGHTRLETRIHLDRELVWTRNLEKILLLVPVVEI